MAALLAGLPSSVPGATVNRLCASGLEAVNAAARAVKLGEGDFYLAGGVESMSRAPWVVGKPERGLPRGEQTMHDTTLGWRLSTRGWRSSASRPSRWARPARTSPSATESAARTRTPSPCAATSARSPPPRRDSSPRRSSRSRRRRGARRSSWKPTRGRAPTPRWRRWPQLRPVFREGGTVTAGNASTLNDGAACLLIASEAGAEKLGAEPLARVVSFGVAGVDPAYMGIGPAEAIPRALAAAGLSLDQIDLIELNEAFASQVLACARELGIDEERLNVNGGAIALGHPLGCSGARLATTLVRELRRRDGRYGIATMCVGVGQGLATVFETV